MTAKVVHTHLWGTRERKYRQLLETDISTTEWTELTPQSPFYLFKDQDADRRDEYEAGWKLTDIMPINGWGIATRKDYLLVDVDRNALEKRFADIKSLSPTEAAEKYSIKTSPHWDFATAKAEMSDDTAKHIRAILFRPFDRRYVYYEKCMIERGDHRFNLMQHFFQRNLGLITVRRTEVAGIPNHFFCTDSLSVLHSTSAKEGNFVFPLYLYRTTHSPLKLESDSATGRDANVSLDFAREFSSKLGLQFVPDGCGDRNNSFRPEDFFNYAYAVFSSPTYRERYAEFLKIDFPRVPLTADRKLFRLLCQLGSELVALHLLESPLLDVSNFITRYPVPGDNLVEKGHPKYLAPGEPEPGTGKPLAEGRVYISKDKPRENKQGQYFEGVPPEVWEFYVGGYQVCEKWLKDRRGRTLSFDDLTHYQEVVLALQETIHLMTEIDAAIPTWPIE